MAELHDLIHSLPQELFDKIYDLTFAVHPATVVTIDRSYKFPIELQISRGTRRNFARRYYSTKAGFRVESNRENRSVLFDWLSNLPTRHQKRIRRIDVSGRLSPKDYEPRRLKRSLKSLHECVIDWDVCLKSQSVLRVEFVDTNTGKQMCMSAKGRIVRRKV
ncbi:hypothetical protein HII31_03719 [Pseudocercospora fuligena]|uniref:Uncharacterized protein n=1 Tax=Pseudocercospora fuligena TaxID=685502 RepID=A0A8H6RNH3_9PEZI|nr:hypothetical protein HII31_03719 [Pseudocercospora fuligena]